LPIIKNKQALIRLSAWAAKISNQPCHEDRKDILVKAVRVEIAVVLCLPLLPLTFF
jgi:hypothetical protein